MQPRNRLTDVERFFDLVTITDKCWSWKGGKHSGGYGVFRCGGRTIGAHRFSYKLAFGAIPKGMEIDHLCKNTSCVRPSHLEAVTHSINVVRSAAWHHFRDSARKIASCPQGHKYDEKNTYIDPKGCKHCRACGRVRAKAYKRKCAAKARGE